MALYRRIIPLPCAITCSNLFDFICPIFPHLHLRLQLHHHCREQQQQREQHKHNLLWAGVFWGAFPGELFPTRTLTVGHAAMFSDCWAPAALSQSGGAGRLCRFGCLAVFAVVAAAACCAACLGQVWFLCHGRDAKQCLLQLHKLAAMSRRLWPLFSRITRQICICMYFFVYSRDVGLCLLGFCYAADLIFSLSAGVCVLMCVLARVCLCYWEDMPRSLTSGKKNSETAGLETGISYLNESRLYCWQL